MPPAVPHTPAAAPEGAGAPAAPRAGEVTVLLRRMHAGDAAALDQLLPLVYDELRGAARRALAREQAGHTLHATELVHEAFFKLAGPPGDGADAADAAGAEPSGARYHDRAHFFAVAARAMRQVLVEHARRRLADKRGGGAVHVTLGAADSAHATSGEELIALDDALERLGAVQPRLRTLVECRYFAGLSERETAAALGVGERTVQRDWARARAWLYRELYPGTPAA